MRGIGIERRPDPSGPFQRNAYSVDTLPGSAGEEARKDCRIKWRPSIYMSRDACRQVLKITNVRVERLHNMIDADALGEDVSLSIVEDWSVQALSGRWAPPSASSGPAPAEIGPGTRGYG